MNWVLLFLQILLLAIVALGLYSLLKIYVFTKFKVNRWIILALAAVEFLVPVFLGVNLTGTWLSYIHSGVFVILFLWFIDGLNVDRQEKKNKKNEIKIRPKAKPNRVKNKDKK